MAPSSRPCLMFTVHNIMKKINISSSFEELEVLMLKSVKLASNFVSPTEFSGLFADASFTLPDFDDFSEHRMDFPAPQNLVYTGARF